MKKLSARKITFLICAAAVLLCCLVTATVLTACKSEPAPPPQSGDEAGVYYYDADNGEEYLLSLGGEMRFTLTLRDGVTEGSYTLQDQTLTLTAGETQYSAALGENTLTLTYDNAQLRFYKKVYYTVSFNTAGGGSIASAEVLNGKTISPADPVRDSYAFIGWYTDSAYTVPYTGGAVTSSMTLYARWAELSSDNIEYTVSYDLGYAGEELAAEKTIGKHLYGAPVPAAREGYTFAGWWISMENKADRLSFRYTEETVFDADTTLFAVWQANDAECAAPAVSVSQHAIEWDAIASVNSYLVTIVAPDDTVIRDARLTTSTTIAEEFTQTGVYRIEVSAATAGGSAIPGATAVRYFVNNALPRVSDIRVLAPDTLVFRGAEGAQKYLITVDCGNDDHVHTLYDNGSSLYFNFSDCDMQEGGIRFTIRATANGYAPSEATFVYERHLDAVTGVAVQDDVLTWNAVAGASFYNVTINGATVPVSGTSLSLKDRAAAKYEISVVPVARGFNSPAAATLSYQKNSPALPGELLLDGTTLSWNAAEGVTYSIVVNGKETAVEAGASSVDLSSLFAWASGSEYTLQLKAAQDANSALSDPFVFRYDELGSVVNYANGVLSWEPVAGALGYEIRFNGDDATIVSVEGGASEYAIKSFPRAGSNTVEVRFLRGSGASGWVSTQVTAHAVTFDSRGGSPLEQSVFYKAVGDRVELPSPTAKDGYLFDAWYNTPNGPESNGAKYTDAFFAGPSELVLYAYYKPQGVKITFSGADGMTDATVYFGEEYTLPVPETTDGTQAFGGWFSAPYGAGTQYTDEYGESLAPWSLTEDVTLYAFWVDNVLTYTWMGNGYSVRAGARFGLVSSVTVPAQYNGGKVTQIAGNAFAGFPSLKEINIPDTVTDIPVSAFEGCTALTAVNVYYAGANYARYSSQDGVLYDSGAENETHAPQPAYMPAGKTGSYRIPDGVTAIPANAFAGSKIDRVVIPASVTQIGTEAFAGCENLVSVVFEEPGASAPALTIGDRAFADCAFTSISLPARLANISLARYDATISQFDDLSDLTETAPDAFTGTPLAYIEVAKSASAAYRSEDGVLFRGNTLMYFPAEKSARGYAIPATTTAVAEGAFLGIVSFSEEETFEIPASVQSIGDFAFAGCGFEALTFKGQAGNIGGVTVGNYAFSEASVRTVSYEENSNVTTLGRGAFKGCEDMLTAVIPASMTSVGDEAFAGCGYYNDELYVEVAEGDEPITFGNDVFTGCTIEDFNVPLRMNVTADFWNGMSVERIVPANGHPTLKAEKNALYILENDVKTTLLRYQPGSDSDADTFEIPASVTTIGESAFRNCKLTSVTIPASVTEIGAHAFEGSTLETITFAGENNTPLTIGESAFEGIAISELTLPDRPVTIGDSAFADIEAYDSVHDMHEPSLATVNLGGTVSIGASAFSNAVIEEIEIPATVTLIGVNAFENNDLASVTFAGENNTALTIGESAFANMTELTSVILPKRPVTIGESAFANTGLTSVNIPSTVTSIGASAFRFRGYYATSSLASVTFENGDTPLTIGEYAFNGIAITELTLPNRPVTIGDNAFANIGRFDLVADETIPTLASVNLGGTVSIGASAFSGAAFTSIEIPASVTAIGESAFSGSALASVTFRDGDGALTIGKQAFSSTAIPSIMLPKQLTEFSPSIFYAGAGGTQLASINKVSADNPAYAAYEGVLYTKDYSELLFCPPMNAGTDGTVTIHKDTKMIASNAFRYCADVTAINFNGAALTSIAANAFSSSGLISIALPDSVQTIGADAFSNCDSLTSFRVPEALDAFDASSLGLENLTEITVSENKSYTVANGVALLKDGVLLYYLRTADETEYTVPDGTTQIAENAFAGNTALTKVTIPASVELIAHNAFNGCSALREVVFAAGGAQPLVIGDYAFIGTSLQSIGIPARTLSIGDNALAISSLTSVSFESSSRLNSIGDNVFMGSGLTAIELPASLTTMGSSVFHNTASLESVRLPEGLTEMGDKTFAYSGVVSVNLPATLRTLGTGTFLECENLKTVDFAQNFQIERFSVNTFEGCTGLEEIELPASLTEVTGELDAGGLPAGGLFEGLYNLKRVTFAENSNCLEIGASAFAETGIISITIPASVTTIGRNAFEGSALRAIVIPRTVTSIGAYAFANCDDLNDAVLGDGLRSIESNTFRNCPISSITIPANVTSIAADAFAGCSDLTAIELAGGNTSFALVDGVLYTADKTQIALMPSGLTKFTLTAAMTTKDVFEQLSNVSSLETVTVEEGNPAFKAMEGAVYDMENNLVFVPRGMKEFIIPDEVTVLTPYGEVDGETGNLALFSGASVKTIGYNETRTQGLTIVGGMYGYYGLFYRLTSLEKISLPDNTKIGANTFNGCSNLTTIEFGGANITIENNNAFNYCSKIATITINGEPSGESDTIALVDGVLYTADKTQIVLMPSGLTKFTLTAAMTTKDVFEQLRGVSSLKTVTVEEGNPAFKAMEGAVYDMANNLVFVPRGMKEFIIPDEVTVLSPYGEVDGETGNLALFSGASVETIGYNETRTQGLTIVGGMYSNYGLFSGLTSLKEISLPDNTTIGANTFNDCSNLTTIDFGGANITIENKNAFNYCSKIAIITINGEPSGESATIRLEGGILYDGAGNAIIISATVVSFTIGKDVAIDSSYLSSLKSMLSGSNVKEILIEEGNTSPYFADFGAVYTSGGELVIVPAAMETFTISARATRIPTVGVFDSTAVTKVTYEEAVDHAESVMIEGESYETAFDGADVSSIELPGWAVIGDYAFYNLSSLETITLSEGIKSIGSNAFYYCTGLTEIELPSTLESIVERAFYICDNISSITIPASVTTIEMNAFAYWNFSNAQTIYVPFAEDSLPAGWNEKWAAGCDSIVYAQPGTEA